MRGEVIHAVLLGGWRDVADDVRRLERGLISMPDTCACNHGSAHLAGSCPCCRMQVHALDSGCTDCEALIASLHDKVDDLMDAALRYLPAIDVIVADWHGVDRAHLLEVRWQILHVAAIFQQLATAAGEFRQGCSTSHLAVLKKLARELAAETRKADDMLDPKPMRRGG